MQKFVKINGTQYNVKYHIETKFKKVKLGDVEALKEVVEKMYPREKTKPNTKSNQATESEKDSDTVGDEGDDSREKG